MTQAKSPRLRLVYDRTKSIRDAASPMHLQYLLPIAMAHNAIMVDSRQLRYNDFGRAIEFASPTWIFDFRRNARFDTITGGRSHAFRIFSGNNAHYVDVMGLIPRGLPFLEQRRSSLWFRTFRSILKKKEVRGPFLFLADDVDLFLDLSPAIIGGLGKVVGIKIGLSILSLTFLRQHQVVLKNVM